MRIIFSRKGVDSGAGGCASPVVEGRCLSLPIPTVRNSVTTYADLGLGVHIERATRGRLAGHNLCHADPEFREGRAAFGQVGAAQSHLANQNVGVGDLFLFFGVFGDGRQRRHRLFGWLRVQERRHVGPAPEPQFVLEGPRHHPHAMGNWNENNAIYLGPGGTNAPVDPALCLTAGDGGLTDWAVPDWLARRRLSYHEDPARWLVPGRLRAVARGQEFVTDIGEDDEANRWTENILERMAA
ncbi:MAG: hypothetical protein ACT4OK_12400 [Gemmobacter sp.]